MTCQEERHRHRAQGLRPRGAALLGNMNGAIYTGLELAEPGGPACSLELLSWEEAKGYVLGRAGTGRLGNATVSTWV